MSEDQDAPISYEALEPGTPVIDADRREFGTVTHVLADEHLDFFDGLVVRTADGIRFVERDLIGTITRARVETTVADAEQLPKPDGHPIYEVETLQGVGDSITAKLARVFGREHWTRTD